MTENEKISNAIDEIFRHYDCIYERKDLEMLLHDIQLHIADVYYKKPFDEDDYSTYDISRELDREIFKAININDFIKKIGADELRKNGIEISDIKATNVLGNDFFFSEKNMSDDDIQSSFDEGIKEISFRNADGESVTFTSYTELKKALDNPDNDFFYKPVQRTPVKNFSSSGAEKLREMTSDEKLYTEFLKFQGRVFKHNASVALEFFTQRPETKFIATQEQWEKTNRTIAQGSEAIRFVDSNGKITDFYDFSQLEKTTLPYQWTINKNNANAIKKQLGIPEKTPLISGVINSTINPTDITACMSALGVPPKDYSTFSKSYVKAIQIVIAGRLEVGGNNFNIPSDLTALKMLKTESQKLAFLTYVANTARKSLMKIENAVKNVIAEERNEKNELHEMENADTTRTEERSGRRTSDNTAGNVEEQSDTGKSRENGRSFGLGDDTESTGRQEHKVVSGVQNENSERSGILVQVQPDMRTVQPESDGLRTVDRGRTDRDLRNEMDGLHGRTLSASGGGNETVSQVSDSSSFSGEESTGVQGLTGRPVRRNESTSDGVRGSAEVGTGENVLLGQHGDEGDSLSSGDGSIEDKLNSVFSSEETEKTSTEKADVFILSDEERLVQITAEIGENQKKYADLINDENYEEATNISQKLTELTIKAKELKEKIQAKPLTKKDVDVMLEIKPPRKSVQNMTETDTAKTVKFESMLGKGMGEKSPYAMRKKGGNDWRDDDSKMVDIVEITTHNTMKKTKLSRKDIDIKSIPTGTFINNDTNAEIPFGRNGIDESIAKAIQDSRSVSVEARMNALYHMEEIIRDSIYFDTQTSEYHPKKSKNKSPNTMFMHRFYGVMKYDDDFYLTNLAVEESFNASADGVIKDTNNSVYSVRDIKITPVQLLGYQTHSQMATATEDAPTSVNISISQLYQFVKYFDENFFENPNAVGREARETELFLQAEYNDAVNKDENKIETKEQIIEFAKSHNISVHKAKKELERAVERYDGFIADKNKDKGFSDERNSELEVCIHKAFDKIRRINNFTESQSEFINNLEKFSVTNHTINNMVSSAFEKSSRFSNLYISEDWINSNVFNGRLSEIKNALNEEIKVQMELLKQEKAKKSTAEKEEKSVLETVEIDLTKGVINAPVIKIAESDLKIDMEEIPQIIFLETDNSDGKFHFNETIFTYDIENVSVAVQESSDNLYGFDNQETLSVEDGTARIKELLERYSEKNMHISLAYENGESESLMQYIKSTSGDYPIIITSPNKNVPEFSDSKTCTVQEYNDLLAEASKKIPEGQEFTLHFNMILSNKRKYQTRFPLTKDTGKLSDIISAFKNKNQSERDYLKALKMVIEEENKLNNSETMTDSNNNNTTENSPETISQTVEESESQTTTEKEQQYPYISVKAGWNYEKYISPELETKDYTVPEFNEALKKLNERWDNEEYETKSAFVTLTIHISETESFEKRLNAEYQFKTLSERLEFESDTFDKEIKLRQMIRDAENQTDIDELTEKGNKANEPDETVSDSPEETHVSEPTVDNVENKPDTTDFNENAVKYALDKIMEEHKYDFTNPTFMYLGHLQNYMTYHKINDIVTGISSEIFQKYYGNDPLTEEYFSAGYTLSKNLPEEYNAYFQEYISMKTVSEKAKELTIMTENDVQKEEPESENEQLELFHIEENRPYQIITYDSDSGADEHEDFATLKEAQKRAKEYLKDNYDGMGTSAWEGYAIYNRYTQTIEETSGYFPTEKIFSVDVLIKNGVITPEQEPEMIKNLMEKEIHDKVISELLKSEDLKTAAKNNTYDDFSFPYYEAVNNTLIKMLENNPSYATEKEITYLLDDAEYLHNVFNDYDTIFKQFAPEKIDTEPTTHSETVSSSEDETTEKQSDKMFRSQSKSEKLYKQFSEMFPDIVSGEHTHERYGNVGDALEPLSVEHLGGNTYAFMTYFIQNGDLMRDPDFEFELDHENKTLNITQYQQDGSAFGTIYQHVYDENNTPDLKLLSSLEKNFMQNLKNAHNMERPLISYTDKNGNEFNSDNEPEIVEPEEPEINDNTPELREVLNEFSEKYNLGELNIEPNHYNWTLSEKFSDGTDFQLGEINSPEYGKPFTSDELRISLEEFEKASEARNQDISDIYGRKSIAESHGGVSELPKVQKNLPEITYASKPSEKINNNISAIREMLRLENAEKNGVNPYDSRSNQPYSKQSSEYRLRQYCGWGGLSQVFDERFKQYDYHRQELHSLLTPEEYSAARASSLNSHYTPQIIIDVMYKAVQNMDLPRDSKILEPACGTGNFISRLPHSFGNAEVTGIELDSITARIAHQINRDNENVKIINSGFENSGLENESFDLAIGNVPFGDYNMNDPDYVQDWRIHDAFFRKALDKVASGGIVAFVTSTGTMDKSNPKIREYLATKAELIGAVRLPNTAFSDAGTGVPSDIIFLKKRENPLQAHEPKPDWCYTIPDKNGLKINSYFVQNPQMVLGEMKKTTFQDRLTCVPFEGADLGKQLNEAIKNLNAKITVAKREKAVNEQRGKIEPWGKNFTFQIKDNKVYYRKGSQMDEIKCTKSEKEMIKKLCEIRDITRKLIDLQKTSVSDSELLPVREKLNKLYDEYKSEHGELSSKSVKKHFGNDSDFPILQSLEHYNKEKDTTEKADIFFRRTVNPMVEIKSVESLEEALQVSLDHKGKPDIPYMAILLDQSPEKVCKELLEKEQIFIDPEKELPDKPYSGVVERSEYLSGNVRMKLTIAEEYAKTNPEYNQNVNALKTVIPEDIKADEISVQMGCPWIDPEDYTQFLEHLSGRAVYNSRRCDVSSSPVTGEFSVLNAGSKQSLNLNETTNYGMADLNMYQLAEKILNQRRIVVQREKVSPKDTSKTVTRTDPKATKIALEKAKLIREEFKKWIFDDEKRKTKYERRYNDIFNSIVGREYDGSHLTFAGMTNDFTLRPHQKNCVARAIYGGNTLAAHVVGAGKSAVIFTSVMKKKELGLINKACVVVPKALTEQTANEWRRVYPDAKILTVTNDDLSNETKRNLFTAKVATGSYDAVILSQEQFEKIPMSKAYRVAFIQKEIDSLEDMLRAKKLQNNGKKDYSVKAIEKSKKQLQAKLEKLLNPKSASRAKDDLLEFEQLEFDYLVCDEAHAYKNGFVTTKMTNVSGVTTRPSGRAEDMQMKTDYFNEQFGQGHILFATGTPVSNTMTELYVMTRYLRPDLLKQAGVERFDDWAATFGNVVTKNQQTADGTLKMKTSFASFANLPELMAMYKEFADVQSADKLNLPRPELKTGKPQIISVPATPEQKAYVHELAERAKQIENGAVEPHEDNHLKITGEARLIGLGNNAVKALYKKRGEELPYDFIDDKNSKVDKCVEKVAEIYNQTQETKGVQIIFSDIAVNSDNGNFSVYDYIKDELIAKGIPEKEIIFAPKSDSKERENIFRDINNSKYRVVIASTGTLGTGANIQQNLCALHHIDVPWKPSDFEQREGRILRQGNKNKEVEIFNYVTEGTLDSYLYQTVTNKARFIAQLLDDKAPARVSEDCDEKVLTYGEIQAAAEGNPDFKRRIEVSNEIAELTMLKNDYVHETAVTREKIELIPKQIETRKELLSHVQKDKKASEKIREIALSGVSRNPEYVVMKREKVNAHLLKMAQEKLANPEKEIPSVNINNFEVSVTFDKMNNEVCFQVKGESTYFCVAGTTENQDNYQRIRNLFEKGIPKKEQEIMKEISALEENLQQAKERVNKPFSHETELAEKIEEFQKLEEKLSGLSVQEDVVFDPEEEPIVETAEEKSAREKIYNVDDDDYQPTEDDDNSRPMRR